MKQKTKISKSVSTCCSASWTLIVVDPEVFVKGRNDRERKITCSACKQPCEFKTIEVDA